MGKLKANSNRFSSTMQRVLAKTLVFKITMFTCFANLFLDYLQQRPVQVYLDG